MKRKAYTLNVPGDKHVREADYFGIASGRDVDKFEETGLTPVASEKVDAPYVAEFPMVLECKVIHHYEIGLHTQFIGEILDVKIEEGVLNGEGDPDMERIRPFVFGLRPPNYYSIGELTGQAFDIGRKD
jgi:flavin reductase (DIM6/NTAB) family NADH-FMN oxidoreductase RutF